MLTLGDMTVIGDVPAKLLKALAVIADTLHPQFARDPEMQHPDKSKESCVLCSLTVRDFLRAIGFVNARVRPVVTLMAAWSGDKQLHSLGIGVPDTPKRDRYWVGHLVVWVPGSRALIDTTLYPSIRPQWTDHLPPMLAVACDDDVGRERVRGLPVITSLMLDDADDFQFSLIYLDNPANCAWHHGPDARRERRFPVVAAMRAKFGRWNDG